MVELIRETCLFYRSFYEAIQCLENPQKQVELYNAIFNYGLNGVIPEALSRECEMLFIAFKPQVRANNLKYIHGQKGGRPDKGKGKKTIEKNEALPLVKTSKTYGLTNKKPNVKENEKEKENVKENEEREKAAPLSFSQKLFQAAFPKKTINADIDDNEFDIHILIEKIKESNFLTNAKNFTLKTCLKHYEKIKNDFYSDKKYIKDSEKNYDKPNQALNFMQKKYTPEQLNELLDDPDEVLKEIQNKKESV